MSSPNNTQHPLDNGVTSKKHGNYAREEPSAGHPQGKRPPRSTLTSKDLGPDDVLLGRGTGPNEYEGNVRFRALIREVIKTSNVQDSEDSKAKTKLAMKIVQAVKDRNGRFLQRAAGSRSRSPNGYTFVVATDKAALDKTKQSLRHQLRMMDPNFKEKRDMKLKLKKLRETMMQNPGSSQDASLSTLRAYPGNRQAGNVDNRSSFSVGLATPHATVARNGPLVGLLDQRSSISAQQSGAGSSSHQAEALARLLGSIAPRAPAVPSATASTDGLASALSKLLSSVSSNQAAPPAPPMPAPAPPAAQQPNELLTRILSLALGQGRTPPPPAPEASAPAPGSTNSDPNSMLLQLLERLQQRTPQAPPPRPLVQQQKSALEQLLESLGQNAAQAPAPASSSVESLLFSLLAQQQRGNNLPANV